MSFDLLLWLLPVPVLLLKKIPPKADPHQAEKPYYIIFILSLGIIGLLLSGNRPYIYLVSGFLFLLFSCYLRYKHQRDFSRLLKNYSTTKTGLITEIKKSEEESFLLKEKTTRLESQILTYEMLYSISRILAKQIDLEKLIKGIKETVSFLRPTLKSFEIYPSDVKRKARESDDKNFQKFEIPIILFARGESAFGGKKEVLGIIEFVEKKDEPIRFADECKIVAAQTALALKRSNLYNLVLERSRVDGLTGLYLRRYFLQRANENFLLSKRYDTFFSLLMIDIDRFKMLNDTYGHPAGDEILKSVSQLMKSMVHPDALLCRYGGEEFAVFIGLAPVEEVKLLAENLRKTVEEHNFAGNLKITISLGIAYKHQVENTVGELIRKADESLYKAKQSGRNRVVEWT